MSIFEEYFRWEGDAPSVQVRVHMGTCSTPINKLTNHVASPHCISGYLGWLAWHFKTWLIGLKFCIAISITIFKAFTIEIFHLFVIYWAHYLVEGLNSLQTTFRVGHCKHKKWNSNHPQLNFKNFFGMNW
jgi:hypothetical protein